MAWLMQSNHSVAKRKAVPAPIVQSSYWGVGPVIGLGTAIHFALAVAIHYWNWPRFLIAFLSQEAAIVLGSMMMLTGAALYLLTTNHLLRARRQQQLITTGPYGWVRHPLYAIGLLLLCPGVCLLFRSWLVLTTPITMAIVMRWVIPKEEQTLLQYFGDAYRSYQERVPMFLPLRRR